MKQWINWLKIVYALDFCLGTSTSMNVYLGLWFLANMSDRRDSYLYCLCLKPLLLIPSCIEG